MPTPTRTQKGHRGWWVDLSPHLRLPTALSPNQAWPAGGLSQASCLTSQGTCRCPGAWLWGTASGSAAGNCSSWIMLAAGNHVMAEGVCGAGGPQSLSPLAQPRAPLCLLLYPDPVPPFCLLPVWFVPSGAPQYTVFSAGYSFIMFRSPVFQTPSELTCRENGEN